MDGLDDCLLRGRGHSVVARFGHGNCIQPQAQPTLKSFLRAVVFTMCQRGQFNRAAHVAGIAHRRGKLVERLIAMLYDGRGNQGHAATNLVHGNDVQALTLI